MASKMSDKETEKFIDAFEQRDRLWRTTSLEYCDRNVRLKAAFDMLPVAVRHVASTCCWCGRGLRSMSSTNIMHTSFNVQLCTAREHTADCDCDSASEFAKHNGRGLYYCHIPLLSLIFGA